MMRQFTVFLALICWLNSGSASPCALGSDEHHNVEKVKIRSVVDGDTVRLENRRLVRFIAINTPEIDHERGNSQPFAKEARDYLQSLVQASGGMLLIKPGIEKKDRHGRRLAHVFTMNGDNVQAALLAQGLAYWIAVPPNLQWLDCYRQQEKQARKSNAGIWATPYSVPKNTNQLGKNDRGFQVIRGKITRIGQGKVFTWLNFGTKVALRIHKKDMEYFTGVDIKKLKHRTVTARGWLFPYKKQLVMQLRHPASLELE